MPSEQATKLELYKLYLDGLTPERRSMMPIPPATFTLAWTPFDGPEPISTELEQYVDAVKSTPIILPINDPLHRAMEE